MAIDYRKIILLIGIALVPFYEIIIRLFPDAVVITPDTRVAKLSLSLLIALMIGLAALYRGINLRVSNKWLLALLVFIPISINRATNIPLIVNGIDSSSFWLWKPAGQIFIYFLMYLGVSSLDLTKKLQKQVISVLYYTALAMTFYVFTQWIGADQFYVVKDVAIIGTVKTPHMIGNLGQPTLVSPYIGLGVISALSLKKYIPAVFMALFLFILDSKMAIGATCVAATVYLMLSRPRLLPYIMVISAVCMVMVVKDFKISDMSGRSTVYKNIIEDIRTSPIADGSIKSQAFTGIGLGSYVYLSPEKHKYVKPISGVRHPFKQAHSDPLQILYSLGMIGLVLYLMANYECFKKALRLREYGANPLIPFICLFLLLHLVSCGSFIFQLGVYQYLGVMLFGILSNQSLIGRE